MSDFLVELSPQIKKIIKQSGLPIPVPPKLERDTGPTRMFPLEGLDILFGSAKGLKSSTEIISKIKNLGGEVLESYDESIKYNSLVFDASGIEKPEDLKSLYQFFQPVMRNLRGCGRILLLAPHPSESKHFHQAAALEAVEGFARSIAKEVGKKGSTANLLWLNKGSEKHLTGALKFFLSYKSSFISGQVLKLSNLNGKSEIQENSLVLKGKVALVTGAARGIGAATAAILAQDGAKVICLDRPEDGDLLKKVASEIDGSALLCDVTNPEASLMICHKISAEFGGLDILVHNAGITRDKTLANMKESYWDQTLEVNLAAVTRITDSLLDGLLRPSGSIICLSSIAGIAGNFGQTNYAASKSGIIGLVNFLSEELKSKSIRVNAIAPGFIETRLTAAIPVVTREVARRMSNLSQGGQPVDIANALSFLASDEASGLTGNILRVCGGNMVGR